MGAVRVRVAIHHHGQRPAVGCIADGVGEVAVAADVHVVEVGRDRAVAEAPHGREPAVRGNLPALGPVTPAAAAADRDVRAARPGRQAHDVLFVRVVREATDAAGRKVVRAEPGVLVRHQQVFAGRVGLEAVQPLAARVLDRPRLRLPAQRPHLEPAVPAGEQRAAGGVEGDRKSVV